MASRASSLSVWAPSSTRVKPVSRASRALSSEISSGLVSSVMPTHRLGPDSFSRWASSRLPELEPFRASKHRLTNSRLYPLSREVKVPPITISSTLSTGWPDDSSCCIRLSTWSNGS